MSCVGDTPGFLNLSNDGYVDVWMGFHDGVVGVSSFLKIFYLFGWVKTYAGGILFMYGIAMRWDGWMAGRWWLCILHIPSFHKDRGKGKGMVGICEVRFCFGGRSLGVLGAWGFGNWELYDVYFRY